jgi:pyruvate-ferredoxin/flavodoxin oxidoreductase
MEAMSYGRAYVAQVAFGSNMNQTVHALAEADSHRGPSIVIAYSHCIAHGFDLRHGASQQGLAVQTGMWPLFRFDPRRSGGADAPLRMDSRPPKVPLSEFMRNETRFRMVEKMDPKRFRLLTEMAQRDVKQRFAVYQQLAELRIPSGAPDPEETASPPAPAEAVSASTGDANGRTDG